MPRINPTLDFSNVADVKLSLCYCSTDHATAIMRGMIKIMVIKNQDIKQKLYPNDTKTIEIKFKFI